MSGGTISNNTAENMGGGVFVAPGETFEFIDETGDIQITGNKAAGKDSNVVLFNDSYDNSKFSFSENNKISQSSRIGVTVKEYSSDDGTITEDPISYSTIFFTTGLSGHGDASNFVSDSDVYNVVQDGDPVEATLLVRDVEISYNANGGLNEMQPDYIIIEHVERGLNGL